MFSRIFSTSHSPLPLLFELFSEIQLSYTIESKMVYAVEIGELRAVPEFGGELLLCAIFQLLFSSTTVFRASKVLYILFQQTQNSRATCS